MKLNMQYSSPPQTEDLDNDLVKLFRINKQNTKLISFFNPGM